MKAIPIIAIIIKIIYFFDVFFNISREWHKNKKAIGKNQKSGCSCQAIANLPWKKATIALVIPQSGQGMLNNAKRGQGTKITKSAKAVSITICIKIILIIFFCILNLYFVFWNK